MAGKIINVSEFNKMPGMISCRTLDDFKAQATILHGIEPFSAIEDHELQKSRSHAKSITYYHNDIGFRGSMFKFEVDACYFGCSVTYGQSVEQHERWTDVVDSSIGWSSNNLALPGLDVESICNIFMAMSSIAKFKHAIFLLPCWYRTLIPLRNGDSVKHVVLFPKDNGVDLPAGDFNRIARTTIDSLFSIPEEYFIDRYRNNLQKVLHVATNKGISVCMSTWCHETVDVLRRVGCEVAAPMVNDKQGLDCSHPGPKSHADFARAVLNSLNHGS